MKGLTAERESKGIGGIKDCGAKWGAKYKVGNEAEG